MTIQEAVDKLINEPGDYTGTYPLARLELHAGIMHTIAMGDETLSQESKIDCIAFALSEVCKRLAKLNP